MSYLVLSASFAYLCHGSTGFINIFYSLSVGIDFKRQILRSKVEPCAVRVKHPTISPKSLVDNINI